MGWIRFVDRQALHYPHGSLAVRLKHKKTYLTRVFACVLVSARILSSGSDREFKIILWKGDFAIVFFFGPDSCKYFCVLFSLPQVSTCREGKLGGFFLCSLATHPVWG